MKNGPYILVPAPSKYPGKKYRGKYCYEHYQNYWMYYGVLPKNDELIHHKNEDKHDNNPFNLEIIKKKKHSSIHAKPIEYLQIICAFCKKESLIEARNYRCKSKAGQKDFYCNRTCMASHFGRGRKKQT